MIQRQDGIKNLICHCLTNVYVKGLDPTGTNMRK